MTFKKVTIGTMILATFLMVSYYLMIINSNGDAEIRYIEPEADYQSFEDLMNHPDLRGKVVYVDFWHTGCSPCLSEFTHLPDLKKYFAHNKNLVFLYLGKDRSVPGEKFRWKKMIQEKHINGYHFFLSNEKYYKFWNETVQDTSILMAFPHHLIVDRRGKIIDNDAAGPDNKLLKTQLLNALKH
jgi:thiol-disulfide isomerase/thioredoxin